MRSLIIDLACYAAVLIALWSLNIHWYNWQYWLTLTALFVLQINVRTDGR